MTASTPAEEKVTDLMAALAASIDEAKAARRRRLAAGRPVYQAGEYDHHLHDTPCEWCGDPIGQAPYVTGPGTVDLYHATPCWNEVSQATPQTEAVAL